MTTITGKSVGGAGALLSKSITSSEVIAYDDLGTEAIRRLTVNNFPVIVVDLFPFPIIPFSPRSRSLGAYLSILLAVVGPADPICLPSLAGDGPI